MSECHSCGDNYSRLAQHWAMGDCNPNVITDYNHSILSGIISGDGSLDWSPGMKNPRIEITITNIKFLEWLKEQLKWLVGDIKEKSSAEEMNRMAIKAGYSNNPDCLSAHRLRTMAHPDIRKYENWYGEIKSVPESVEFDKTLIKLWYCGDGTLHWGRDMESPSTAVITKTTDGKEQIADRLRSIGFKCNIRDRGITMVNYKEFLDWMGNPVPGFEYKWCCESYDKYKQLMKEAYEYGR